MPQYIGNINITNLTADHRSVSPYNDAVHVHNTIIYVLRNKYMYLCLTRHTLTIQKSPPPLSFIDHAQIDNILLKCNQCFE